MRIDVRVIVDAWAKRAAAFYKRNFQACLTQHVCSNPAAGTASHHTDIEEVLLHFFRPIRVKTVAIVLQLPLQMFLDGIRTPLDEKLAIWACGKASRLGNPVRDSSGAIMRPRSRVAPRSDKPAA
jgi:hypothetical protein